jgi:hypothetical protein
MKTTRKHLKMQKIMLGEIIDIMKRRSFSIVIIFLLFSCCKPKVSSTDITLFLDTIESQYTDDRFLIDSICIEYRDSMSITRYTGDYQFKSQYYKKADGIYEVRERWKEGFEYLGIDTILTFCKSDTTFIYNSAYDFISIVFQYTLADAKYSILKENDTYKTIKQSLIDTTYTETFFYVDKFNIYKFINTWQDNKCVYVKRE